MTHFARYLLLLPVTLLLLVSCDNDQDGYDDKTGEPVAVNVTYEWTGTSAIYWNGLRMVTRDTPVGHGSAQATIDPGDGALLDVVSEAPGCSILTGPAGSLPVAGGAGHCELRSSDIW